jgi:hypothetical protein
VTRTKFKDLDVDHADSRHNLPPRLQLSHLLLGDLPGTTNVVVFSPSITWNRRHRTVMYTDCTVSLVQQPDFVEAYQQADTTL